MKIDLVVILNLWRPLGTSRKSRSEVPVYSDTPTPLSDHCDVPFARSPPQKRRLK